MHGQEPALQLRSDLLLERRAGPGDPMAAGAGEP